MTRRAEITRSVQEAGSVQIGRQFIKSMPGWLRSKMLEQLENFQSFRKNLRRNSNFAQGSRGNSESTSALTIEASEAIGKVLNNLSGKISTKIAIHVDNSCNRIFFSRYRPIDFPAEN